MMVHSPLFNFNSILPASTDVLEAHNLVEQVCCISLPDSPFDDSAVFSGALSETFVCGESSEEAPAAEGGSASGSASASPSEEAQLSQRGAEPRRQQPSGRSRGGGGRSSESKHPLYKGVRKRQGERWVSEIREPGKKTRIWLGTFATPEMAACAYDVAAYNLKTPYAYLNFPDYVSSLPIPASLSRKHIQEAASAAAAAFRGAASISHGGRTGGVVPTSQVGETSTLPSTSSTLPEQQQSSTSSPMPEQQHELHPQSTAPQTISPSFFDEDLIFNMPTVLADMAEGLMMTPPLLHHDTDADNNNGDNDGAESSLWDF